MSQQHTRGRSIAIKKFSSSSQILRAIPIIVIIFAFYLIMVLCSFSPCDRSWLHASWHGSIHNLGGIVGAWFADTLFFYFGVLAYVLPCIMCVFCWSNFTQRNRRGYVDLFSLSFRLIGSLALLLTSCGIVALNVNDLYYFSSGGLIGSLLIDNVLPWFHGIDSTLMLLCVWALGLTLFVDW